VLFLLRSVPLRPRCALHTRKRTSKTCERHGGGLRTFLQRCWHILWCSDKAFRTIQAFQKGDAIFTQPAGVVKCAGAPQKIMWLALDHWKRAGLYNPSPTSAITISFATGLPSMFGVPKYGGVPKETFGELLGIDQGVPRKAFYHLKKEFFPWVYANFHVNGTWGGPKGFVR
jgi:hypothetical protein